MPSLNINDTIPEVPCVGYQRFLHAWSSHFIGDTERLLRRYPKEAEWEDLVNTDWGYQQPAISASELLDTFPEALPIIKRNLKIQNDVLKETEKECNEILDDALAIGAAAFTVHPDAEKEEKYSSWAANFFYNKPLGEIEARIRQLEHQKNIYEWKDKPRSSNTITEADIERAKTYPLINLVQISPAGFILCPFHNEKTPSCKVFKDNKFRCFGCGQAGDVIDYICKTEDIDFLSAVRRILKK